jgi:hypothetical protein
VGLLTALEAKWVSALAQHITNAIVLVFYTIIAPLIWAPSNILIIIGVWFAKPFVICAQIVSLKIFKKHRVRNCHVTHVLWASCFHTLLEPVIHCLN